MRRPRTPLLLVGSHRIAEAKGGTRSRETPHERLRPDSIRALLRTRSRALRVILRLLAYNGEHYLATALNA